MNNQKPGMFKPALIGGIIAGILSGIPFFHCLCCIWIIGGAMLASYLLAKDSPVNLSAGDGAIVGILTGIVAAVARFFVILLPPVQRLMEMMFEYAKEMLPEYEALLERERPESGFMVMSSILISFVFFAALGALGGIIGVSLFGKKKAKATGGVSDVSEDAGDRQS